MSNGLDMSLDDLIKTNKKPSTTARASGPARRRNANRPAPYSMGKVPAQESPWRDGVFTGQAGIQPVAIETGAKIYVSNLNNGVSNDDIKELFSEVGELKRYSFHYDRSGRSKGTAEVVFSRRADAAAAVKRYNNVQLDGKLMTTEMVGTNIVTPAAMPRVTDGILGNPYGVLGSGHGMGTLLGPSRGGGSGGNHERGGRGRARGRGRGEQISAEELDADLDKYHSERMQIN